MAESKELLQVLWSGADVLRGKMDANEYKTYLLGLVFYKYLSDSYLSKVYDLLYDGVPESIEEAQRTYEEAMEGEDAKDLLEELQESLHYTLTPDMTYISMLKDAKNNSFHREKLQASEFEKALDEDSISYKEYTVSDSNDIASVVQSAVSECDVLYIPTDNTMAGNTESINNIALPAGVPIIAGEEGICSGCGVATLSISYYDIGYTAGKMAYDVLVNGADISTMDVQYAENVTKEYNADICSQLGITVPDDYTAIAAE